MACSCLSQVQFQKWGWDLNMAINSSVSPFRSLYRLERQISIPFYTSACEIGLPFHSDFVTNSYGES